MDCRQIPGICITSIWVTGMCLLSTRSMLKTKCFRHIVSVPVSVRCDPFPMRTLVWSKMSIEAGSLQDLSSERSSLVQIP